MNNQHLNYVITSSYGEPLMLEKVKDVYYAELALGTEVRSFGQYLTENYTKLYDAELNFIGYERG